MGEALEAHGSRLCGCVCVKVGSQYDSGASVVLRAQSDARVDSISTQAFSRQR